MPTIIRTGDGAGFTRAGTSNLMVPVGSSGGASALRICDRVALRNLLPLPIPSNAGTEWQSNSNTVNPRTRVTDVVRPGGSGASIKFTRASADGDLIAACVNIGSEGGLTSPTNKASIVPGRSYTVSLWRGPASKAIASTTLPLNIYTAGGTLSRTIDAGLTHGTSARATADAWDQIGVTFTADAGEVFVRVALNISVSGGVIGDYVHVADAMITEGTQVHPWFSGYSAHGSSNVPPYQGVAMWAGVPNRSESILVSGAAPHYQRSGTHQTNGYGMLGDNSGFTPATYRAGQGHTGAGSFEFAGQMPNTLASSSYEVNPATDRITASAWARSATPTASGLYLGWAPYDAEGRLISPTHTLRVGGSALTTLAAALNPGATTMQLTDATGWFNGASSFSRYMNWWPFEGYANYTYSRNVAPDLWPQGGISGNTVTLNAPWAGPALPSGTPVRNTFASATYKYTLANNTALTSSWVRYQGVLSGLDSESGWGFSSFPRFACTSVRLLCWRTGNAATFQVSDVDVLVERG